MAAAYKWRSLRLLNVETKCRAAVAKTNKSALDFSVKDASAALPQNCQTTKWILVNYSFGVNVTLVMRIMRLWTGVRDSFAE
jgi:hypothetical protein